MKVKHHINSKQLLHRIDGPAIEHDMSQTSTFPMVNLWWINGNEITEDIMAWSSEMGIDLNNLSETDISLIEMKYSDLPDGSLAKTVAYTMIGVQPMVGPAGSIFGPKTRQSKDEK